MAEKINLLTWLILFVVYTCFDTLYVIYIQAITDVKALKASIIGSVMYLLTAYGTIEYIDNFVNLIPILVGGFIGTFFTLKLGSKKR